MKLFFILSLILFSSANSTIISGVNFVFVGSSLNDTKTATLADNFEALINTKYHNLSLPTVLYAHGFLNNFKSESTVGIIEAYLSRGDHNIIAIDWGKYALNINYIEIALQLNKVKKITENLTNFDRN